MKKNISIFLDTNCLKIFFLGFSSGLPLLLVFSTLSVWLIKAGIDRSTVTLFSWAGFAYAFKYLWSPIVDNFDLPILKKIGHRKSWLILSQLLIIISIILVAFSDPNKNITLMAISVSLLAFFSATQDISVDAYRIESAGKKLQGPFSSMYIAGYRVAMIFSGAGSLWLASYLGNENYNINVWKTVYLSMSFFMLVGIITVLISEEPKKNNSKKLNIKEHWKFILSIIIAILVFGIVYNFFKNPFPKNQITLTFFFSIVRLVLCFSVLFFIFYFLSKIKLVNKKVIIKTYFNPINNFIRKYSKLAVAILLLISIYRIADVVMGVIANIFYIEKGYTVNQIATFSKFFGLIATLFGGFLGGYSAFKIGTMRALLIGAFIAAFSNLLFAWLASVETNVNFLISVIIADNISSGFAGAAFVVYLSKLTSIRFTATQYALFSSLMLFFPKLIAGYAGSWVNIMGYEVFFIFTAILGVPVIFLIYYLKIYLPIKNDL